jgi:hypothetical protein
MPRFFFDFREGDTLSPDEEGVDFPDVMTAELEAMRAAADVGAEVFPSGRASVLTVEVRSETGRRLTEVTASMVVKRFHADSAD